MAYNTVKVTKYSDVIIELAASAAILPGMLVEQVPAAATVRAHASAGGNVVPIMFALEDELQGRQLDDGYVAGDQVQCWIPHRGDIVYARVADEQNIAIGDLLMSNGAGRLTKYVAESWESADAQAANTLYPNLIVGRALAALDLSGLSTTDSSERVTEQFVKVRIV